MPLHETTIVTVGEDEEVGRSPAEEHSMCCTPSESRGILVCVQKYWATSDPAGASQS